MALIRAVAEGEAAEAWARGVGEDWLAGARAIKVEGDCGVWQARIAEREVVVKTWRLGGSWGRRSVQSALTLSPAWRHWRAAHRLAAEGFATARPLAIATVELEGARVEALALEALEGVTALEALAGGMGARVEAAIARAVGAQVGRLARAGWYNRDHKPSNLIATRAEAAEAIVTMIDCVGFRRVRPGSEEFLARMLAKLLIEPVGCGVSVRRALRWRVLREAAGDDRARRRRLWAAVERIVAEHGDPAPKVDPLRAPSASSGKEVVEQSKAR
jgi:tRNA A-37 threonylcarbamoyl transferase component Bud32